LREAFKDFGHIVRADITTDDRGKSRGYGVVMFETKNDAEEAIRVMD
jgi:RNA recognition motif-containing protein